MVTDKYDGHLLTKQEELRWATMRLFTAFQLPNCILIQCVQSHWL